MSQSKYKTLLSSSRMRKSSVTDRTNIILDAESDRGRLIFCPAFRRLQQKAQVFSMESNAAVRSRLTHSLEVSQIGRYMADSICILLKERGFAEDEECTALVTFVETACLMHDIGNPPFGHFGEAAIANWFQQNGGAIIKKSLPSSSEEEAEKFLVDFMQFDGNPQGLRVVTKLQRNNDEYGLNLTKTTLASYLKYLRCSYETIDDKKLFNKKCGYFLTEEDTVKSIWKNFGFSCPQRFPLAYIMEASDDIAYCISDLEDSIEKKFLDKKNCFEEIFNYWEREKPENEDEIFSEIKSILESSRKSETTYTDFRTKINRALVKFCAQKYIDHHDDILNGTIESLLPEGSSARAILEAIKKFCRETVYCNEVIQRVELAGYTAIYGLLDRCRDVLECEENRFLSALDYKNKDSNGNSILTEKKILKLFPKNYIVNYHSEINNFDKTEKDYGLREWNARAHLVVDFISGMTDDFAMSTYQELSGIKL